MLRVPRAGVEVATECLVERAPPCGRDLGERGDALLHVGVEVALGTVPERAAEAVDAVGRYEYRLDRAHVEHGADRRRTRSVDFERQPKVLLEVVGD